MTSEFLLSSHDVQIRTHMQIDFCSGLVVSLHIVGRLSTVHSLRFPMILRSVLVKHYIVTCRILFLKAWHLVLIAV